MGTTGLIKVLSGTASLFFGIYLLYKTILDAKKRQSRDDLRVANDIKLYSASICGIILGIVLIYEGTFNPG